jgi:hypothetical protein
MIARYKTKAGVGIVVGLASMLVALFGLTSGLGTYDGSLRSYVLGLGLSLAVVSASVVFCWGCAMFAKAKGYPAAYGAVLGVAGWIGLIVLFIRKDKCKDGIDPGARGFSVVVAAPVNPVAGNEPV